MVPGVLQDPAVPSSSPADRLVRRDALGWACHGLHLAILAYILTGWLLPGQLGFYLVFLPAMAVHWRLNAATCLINNLETLVRTGRWRDPASLDEGAWIANQIEAACGIRLTRLQNNLLTHAVLAGLWALAFWHWQGW